ncbi:MAG: thioredoxin domain-containing protein [Pseudomonadota bacterium]|nr:thioredoxin domain-containing protein [Pseudomonadota bacterium]
MTRQNLIGFGVIVVIIAVAAGVVMSSNSKTTVASDTVSVETQAETGVVAEVTEAAEDAAEAVAETAEAATEEVSAAVTASAAVDYSDAEAVKAHVMKVRTLGNPDAKVKLEEFASLTCSHCANFHTQTFGEVKSEMIDKGEVFFTFTDFPLNAPALEASIVARCLPEDRYFKFISFLFENQSDWAFNGDFSKSLRQNAKLVGASDEMLDACLTDDIRAALLTRMQEAGQKHGISSTPSFVFNDGAEKLSGSQPYPIFKGMAEKLTSDGESQ